MPAPKATKKSGKENAPLTKSRVIKGRDEGMDDDEGSNVDEDGPGKRPPSSQGGITGSKIGKVKGKSEDGVDEKSSGELQRKFMAMTAERDRIRSQRDTFATQFEELSNLRNTEAEALFDKFRSKAEQHARAQTDVISSLTVHNEKLQEKIASLEKALASVPAGLPSAGGVFEAAASKEGSSNKDKERLERREKEILSLKDELAKTQANVKERESRISQLERDYKAEVAHSRSLQASSNRNPLAASVSTTPEEADKDAQSLKLYEDLTDLNITNVKIKTGKAGKEVTFICVQTVEGRSLNFKLRAYNEPDPSLVGKGDNPWIKMLLYTPEGLEYEDPTFKQRLGFFASEFVAPRDQAQGLWESLKVRISPNGEVGDDE
ncbi:hypothetical protein TREMEDRAFT_66185 [Tremella mesenterica DSM 1558]|uniref:uncharacterized protein n=1 Tax=Tremella mesenterica (strain ATCC 24925 / CBS 8224 / DSM 1558 / NBRC 9311 / NRRL Y-6157 / RJB 2259-6 / UBC 559-6) TaxID=578456 RepID=UPI00032C2225|nr:uncharacterized protein TREMEDRAFT_66185 [Tremella mesenterica DSM 1558]EIW65816.1 hypothetical protein TREMEDRAFT_66185 [Tremella mesenterica DSM 1558]